MKRTLIWVGAVSALFVLASCASLPAPERTGSSLVIGSLVVDFPDGYFDQTPARLDSRVQLNLTDVTTGREFRLTTEGGGFYYFPGTPGDTYRLDSWEFYQEIGHTRYRGAPYEVKLEFRVPADKVVYTGHLLYTFTKPESKELYQGRKSFSFKTSATLSDRPDTVKEFIARKQEDSPWLAYDIVEAQLARSK